MFDDEKKLRMHKHFLDSFLENYKNKKTSFEQTESLLVGYLLAMNVETSMEENEEVFIFIQDAILEAHNMKYANKEDESNNEVYK